MIVKMKAWEWSDPVYVNSHATCSIRYIPKFDNDSHRHCLWGAWWTYQPRTIVPRHTSQFHHVCPFGYLSSVAHHAT